MDKYHTTTPGQIRLTASLIYIVFVVIVVVLTSWVFAVGAIIFKQDSLSRLEGENLKVVTAAVIFDDRPGSCDNCTEIRLQYYKGRSCKLERFAVFEAGNLDELKLIPSKFLNKETNPLSVQRPLGLNRTDWIQVDAPYFSTGRFQYLIKFWHRCHSLWASQTTIYSGILRKEGPHNGQ